MIQLHIDVETYSSVDIRTAGVYKYCESLDFEITLLAYAFNNEPVIIIDVAQGEKIPTAFIDAMYDPKVEKHAHNATFERRAFKAIGIDVPIQEWHCSAIKAGYCGYPLGLQAISDAMKLGDKGKLKTGSALIRYFCIPCKPTIANDQRERNLPHHDLAGWEEFKVYCINDVEAEREIGVLLDTFTLPDSERELYMLDQKINDRGILVDTNMSDNAVRLNGFNKPILIAKMKKITKLANPNSAKQLCEWLGTAMQKEVKSLAKAEIPKLLEAADLVPNSGDIKEVLMLRQQASKTSVKKYLAMQNCTTEDGRAHGLFQFYGASRTGRWAGRLIQLQNLPRNYIKNIEVARDYISRGNYNLVTMLYDNVADVLSQLIRTALIAKEGHTLAIADFSAIEARILSWLADEKWRLKIFATHGKIYEASAAMMYNIPIAAVDSEMRRKGKISELALGYQGAIGAMKQMGGEAMGLSEAEMKHIVVLWRSNNPEIVRLWAAVDKAVIQTVRTGKTVVLEKYKNLTFRIEQKALTIKLPSGRKLIYQTPTITTNKWGRPSVKYQGPDPDTKKWGWVESYGGKFVENITQAIARDALGVSMLRLDKAGHAIVMHVHDEVIVETPTANAEVELDKIYDIMAERLDWAEDLILTADGFVTPFYKKD